MFYSDIEKLLKRLCLCPTKQAPSIASAVLKKMGMQEYATRIKNVRHPVWKNITTILIDAERHIVYGNLEKYFSQITEITTRRLQIENSLTAITQNSIAKKASLFSHFNAIRFQRLFTKILATHNYGSVRHTLLTDIEKNDKLFRVIKILYQHESEKYFLNARRVHLIRIQFLHALHTAMLVTLGNTGTQPEAVGDFFRCKLCWRYVHPSSRPTGLCHEHDYSEGSQTAYKKFRKIFQAISARKICQPSMPAYLAGKLWQKLRCVWQEQGSETLSVSEWINRIAHNPLTLAQETEEVTYALSPVWKICNRTRRFVENSGGDPFDPQSVLTILDADDPHDSEAVHNARKILHSAIAKNFSFYRSELALAEALMRLHATMFGWRRHGGNRRPPKTPAA